MSRKEDVKTKINRLGLESSPYLRQHQSNPVDWYAWGPEAFEAAQSSGKPILLSVGYSSCHWCHVMAHESFENPDIAALMNALFINVKVDREERPDLDIIYQSALALMKEPGGWPLTVFLTPDGEPFWGGTYFPPEPRFGRPGFNEVLLGIAKVWNEEREKVLSNVDVIKSALDALSAPQSGTKITLKFLDDVAHSALQAMDPVFGGTRGAPKFPQVPLLRMLWRAWRRTQNPAFFDAVHQSLERMCQGGIYDHLGGGFARYATDERWLVPHFEKMLYDNAQLIGLMTQVWLETHEPLLAARVNETIDWVLQDMRVQDDDGLFAFAGALDADSEGAEGRYYIWREDEIDNLLRDQAPLFKQHYGITEPGNWEGVNILSRSGPYPETQAVEEALKTARILLLDHRQKRPAPGRDDKVLADVNGLAIQALCEAGVAFGRQEWLDAATTAFNFVCRNMVVEGRLQRTWTDGMAKHAAVLDDIAQMTRAALCLFEATGDEAYLAQAQAWTNHADELFWCAHNGGYCLSAQDIEDVIVRTRTSADNALPSGNGTMADVLARLYLCTGEDAYRQRAETLIDAFPATDASAVVNMPTLLGAFELLASGGQVVIADKNGDGAAMVAGALKLGRGLNVVLRTDAKSVLPSTHPAFGKEPLDGRPTAYVCQNGSCSEPLTNLDALLERLNRR